MNNTEYDSSGIIKIDFSPLVEAFLKKEHFTLGNSIRGNYTSFGVLTIDNDQIARIIGGKIKIRMRFITSLEVYNLLPEVKLELINYQFHLNGKIWENPENWTDI